MPLKYIRMRVPRVTLDDALNIAILSASTTQQLANLSQFPPVSTAAGILLAIFQTIQNVQTNKKDCYRLARRCLALLEDMKDHMHGRWQDAPDSLIKALKKFEGILVSIGEYMTSEAENKWHNRLMRKNTIENALQDFNAALDDATRSFQIVTLINIHYAVGDRKDTQALDVTGESIVSIAPSEERECLSAKLSMNALVEPTTDVEHLNRSSILLVNPAALRSFSIETKSIPLAKSSSNPVLAVDPGDSTARRFQENEIEEYVLEDHGFRKYHQSELILKGRSRIKEGWWAGAVEASVGGQKSLVKRYEGPRKRAMQVWLRDVKVLQNVFHPNLPQMIGYSNEETPTPFILLANVQTRLPQALVLDVLQKGSLASCATLLVRFYKETLDAALYLQRQLNLSDSKTQDYVEYASFRIDAEQTLVMGLPPPEVDKIESYRNFGLTHSVKSVFLQLLPNRGYAKEPCDPMDKTTEVGRQLKINHLAVLVQALLPSSADSAAVSLRLGVLLGEDDGEEEETSGKLTLRAMRLAALDANTHQQTWRQNTVPAYKHAVGDLGYVPSGKGFDAFTVLCNVLDERLVDWELTEHAEGNQFSWEHTPFQRQNLQAFGLPGDVSGWTIVVPPGTKQQIQIVHESSATSSGRVWQYLLEKGKDLAQRYDVRPEDLILVTKTGLDLRLYVQDLRQPHHHAFNARMPTHHHLMFPSQQRHGFSGFSGQHHSHGFIGPFPPESPALFYLFTSRYKEHAPYWSETPFYVPPKGKKPPELKARCWTGSEWTYGYLNYVQLHAEDFVS